MSPAPGARPAPYRPPNNLLFWVLLLPMVLFTVGTFGFIAWTRWNSPYESPLLNYGQQLPPTSGAKPMAPSAGSERVDAEYAVRAQAVCDAVARLTKTLGPEDVIDTDALWKSLGRSDAPPDQFGRPVEWQPWNRSVRSAGPDGARGTPDDLLFRCGN